MVNYSYCTTILTAAPLQYLCIQHTTWVSFDIKCFLVFFFLFFFFFFFLLLFFLLFSNCFLICTVDQDHFKTTQGMNILILIALIVGEGRSEKQKQKYRSGCNEHVCTLGKRRLHDKKKLLKLLLP